MAKWEYTETELWRYGENDYSIYHVFASVAVKQWVLVFAEARKGDGSDAECEHDIVMKKSCDGGRTFSEGKCILKGEKNICLTNAVPLYDSFTKRLFLFYSDNQKNVKTKNFVAYSDDLGDTFSDAVPLNDVLENVREPLPFHLAGPGHGICLERGEHAGRLLMQFWHRSERRTAPSEERGYCVSVLLSDDHGKTWRTTEYFGKDLLCNESRLAETKDGVLWIARTRDTVPAFSTSFDGGENWAEFAPVLIPGAKCCDVGAVSLQGKAPYEDTVLLSRVSCEDKRRDMEIRISTDGGRRFDARLPLMQGDAMPGYSDLSVICEEEPVVGLVHCRENHVLFSRISMQTLTGGKYENTERFVWP